MGNWQTNYEVCENELGQKRTTQKIPLTNTNGLLNNKQITLNGVPTKEKRELGNIKGTMKGMSQYNYPSATCSF
jgi:hypothetical protein